jgi:hypothetical protein
MASDGGAAPIPGVTIFGLGSQISVACGFVKSFSNTDVVCARQVQMAKLKQKASNNFIRW